MSTAPDVVTVRLLGVPLQEWERADEHYQDLRREFALLEIRAPQEHAHHIPKRLEALITALSAEYARLGEGALERRDEALAAGETSVDLDYAVPRAVAQACRDLDVMLDEADEFCRRGRHLLTLETPPELVVFRKWYLQEFIDQIERGAEPTAWPEFRRQADGAPF